MRRPSIILALVACSIQLFAQNAASNPSTSVAKESEQTRPSAGKGIGTKPAKTAASNQANSRYATSYPGADIGEQINNAISSLPAQCGEVIIPAGSYPQKTTIKKPRCVRLHGEAARATVLNWSDNSGTAIIVGDTQGPFEYPEGEIADLTLNGRGDTTSAIGIYIGGDPSNKITDSSVFADHQNFNRIRITNFGVGMQWGNNAWSITVFESLISSEGVGLFFPSGLTNSGEAISIISSRTQNSKAALMLVGFSDFFFFGSSCDYNLTCGTVNAAHFFGEHFEQASGTILTIKGTSQPHVEIFGGWAQLTAHSGKDAQMFLVDSPLNPTFIIDGAFILAGHNVENVVNWHGSGGASILALENLPYYTSNGNILSLTNTDCRFWGCRIEDGQGNLVINADVAKTSILSNRATSPASAAIPNNVPQTTAAEPTGTCVIQGYIPMMVNGKELKMAVCK